MKAVIAIDSFKGSLSSVSASEAIALGILDVYPDAEIIRTPIADGGEGTVEAIITGAGGEYRSATVKDPVGKEIEAVYGFLPDGTAVIEMASAAGITLVSDEKRDPMIYDTYGVGELMLEALHSGAKGLVIGIGGSATNDGGVGMLRALGFSFLDEHGNDIGSGAEALWRLCKIDTSGANSLLKDCKITVACDVKNPLCGENGATYVYGPQKGVTPEMKPVLDGYLARYAELTREAIPNADPTLPGSGAAGGLGFALMSYLGAELRPGIEIVTELNRLSERLADADIVITGEGRMDAQSAMGKAPAGVAALAKKYGKTVIALSGAVTDDASALREHGIDAIFPIARGPISLRDAMRVDIAAKNMRLTAREVFSLIKSIGLS